MDNCCHVFPNDVTLNHVYIQPVSQGRRLLVILTTLRRKWVCDVLMDIGGIVNRSLVQLVCYAGHQYNLFLIKPLNNPRRQFLFPVSHTSLEDQEIHFL